MQVVERVLVEVDGQLCVGSQTCVATAPESFAMTDAGISQPTSHQMTESQALREAEELCPVQAIRVRPTGQE